MYEDGEEVRFIKPLYSERFTPPLDIRFGAEGVIAGQDKEKVYIFVFQDAQGWSVGVPRRILDQYIVLKSKFQKMH